ncbi:MAG: DNA polymerase III subunit alpha [Chromatiales bacterium]|nr:DNA polymerase III subunit alpha [Gammaproteobacteria bacterium]MBW6476530.1 DNA polymerase III subunit alpha [Chromatiales bacterium]
MSSSFVHLHLHTEFSLTDGLVRVKPLMKAVAAKGMAAVALTDQSNLFAMVKFYSAALNAGVKPIIGCDIWLENPLDANQPSRLVLLCKDQHGYRNLARLISRSYIENQHRGIPIVRREWLQQNTRGLIALSGGRDGDVGQALLAGKRDLAAELLTECLRLFGDNYYLELCRTGRAEEENYLHQAIALAGAMGVPVVASNDVRFLTAEEFDAHEVRVCIHDSRTLDDPRRAHRYSEQQYLRSPEEMAELFADIPEALENSVEIARRCNLELTLGEYFLPEFPVPDGLSKDDYFRQLSRDGLEKRLDVLLDRQAPDFAERRKPYDARLEMELDVIIQMGFPGYFLIVADFIQWAKNNAIPVGPGRGSGAGSLVAYALTITDLDPLAYDLLFERFLNPERVSMPDFDIDFCMEGRDRVIDYVAQHYGREKVSQIITYGTMAAKAVVRDVGRVLGHGYGFVDTIAKLIPFEIGMTLDKALEQEPDLKDRYDNDEEVRGLIDMALQLEGITRNAGKHAGGVVIAPTELTDFSPLYCEEGGQSIVTQFDKNDVESVGLVKFDFLGLRTLTIIDWALQNIRSSLRLQGKDESACPDITLISLDDRASFINLKKSLTTAVFQLESRGMKDLITRLQPDCFEDIIALVALFRPGPLQSGMVDDFINRKHGRAKVEYPHPDLEPVLKPTYGIILYQEQVQRIAQVLAGYSLGGADLLRRAMGKKKPEEMAKQRETFTVGAVDRGVEEATASYIFDLMEKFAGYGFNKSHSAAYALVSYQTLWLKTHYPAEFMAAVLSADMDNTDKVVTLIEECHQMGLKVVSPSVNSSVYKFTVDEQGAIVYGLGAIKGVGEGAIEGIVNELKAHGPFADLFDFCRRVDTKKANRRVLESLVRAGALDKLGPRQHCDDRATLMGSLPMALRLAEQDAKNRDVGMADMFGFSEHTSQPDSPSGLEELPCWDDDSRLLGEKETLGLYLTGHPINQYMAELRHFTSCPIADLQDTRNKVYTIAGLIIGLRTRPNKRGDKWATVTLDDRSGRIEVNMYAEVYARFHDLLIRDKVIVVQGEVRHDEYAGGLVMRVAEVYDLERAREHFAKGLFLQLERPRINGDFGNTLRHALEPFREGGCPIRFAYANETARAELVMGDSWRVRPSDALLARLRQILGEQAVQVEY